MSSGTSTDAFWPPLSPGALTCARCHVCADDVAEILCLICDVIALCPDCTEEHEGEVAEL